MMICRLGRRKRLEGFVRKCWKTSKHLTFFQSVRTCNVTCNVYEACLLSVLNLDSVLRQPSHAEH